MSIITMGDAIICGNFSEIQQKKPEPFDYDSESKWIEDYPLEWRETLGRTVCNCKKLEVHYAPYYGWDYYHMDSCNLVRKLYDNPGIRNLYESYLPRVTRYTDAVPADTPAPLYISGRTSTKHIKVKQVTVNNTLPLFGALV